MNKVFQGKMLFRKDKLEEMARQAYELETKCTYCKKVVQEMLQTGRLSRPQAEQYLMLLDHLGYVIDTTKNDHASYSSGAK